MQENADAASQLLVCLGDLLRTGPRTAGERDPLQSELEFGRQVAGDRTDTLS